MTGQTLLAWLKLLALDGDLAEAEPRTLRPVPHPHRRSCRIPDRLVQRSYRVLHAAA